MRAGLLLWASIVLSAVGSVVFALLDTPEAETRLGLDLSNQFITFLLITLFVGSVGIRVVLSEAENHKLREQRPTVEIDLPLPIHGYKGGSQVKPRQEVVIKAKPDHAPLVQPMLWIVSVSPPDGLRSGVSYPTRQYPQGHYDEQDIAPGGLIRLPVFSPNFHSTDHEGIQQPNVEGVMDRLDPKEGLRYAVQYRITGTNLLRPKEFYGFISWESEVGFKTEWHEGFWKARQ